MKEFERWRDKERTGAGIWTTAALREGWKAALEWVLDMKKEDVYGGDMYNKAYHIPDWAIDIIEDELKG